VAEGVERLTELLEETAGAEEEAQFFHKLAELVHKETMAELETSTTVEVEVDRVLLAQEETTVLTKLVEQVVLVRYCRHLGGFYRRPR
jgi:hypothetical protein